MWSCIIGPINLNLLLRKPWLTIFHKFMENCIFKGELEVFDRAHIWEKEQQLSSRELASFSTTLLEKL